MCRFIILLLLLCNNNGRCTKQICECKEEKGMEYERHESCTCTACENPSDKPCIDSTDSRTIYLNTTAVNCQK